MQVLTGRSRKAMPENRIHKTPISIFHNIRLIKNHNTANDTFNPIEEEDQSLKLALGQPWI